MLCEDLKYPKAFEDAIVASMRSQIQLHNDNLRKKKQLCVGFFMFLAFLRESMREQEQEQRHLITLNLVINSSTRLCDQFEWDVADTNNSPEIFARHLATDLGLSREYEVYIAHRWVFSWPYSSASIRTQIEGFVSKPELKLPSISDAFRPATLRDEFTPKILDL